MLGIRHNINVLFDPHEVEGHVAPAVRLQGSIDEALQALLAGSALTYEHLNANTVVVRASRRALTYRARSNLPARKHKAWLQVVKL